MALVVTQTEMEQALSSMYPYWNANGYKMHLFQNNYTPLITSVASDFTECTFGGYSGGIYLTSWSGGTIAFITPRAFIYHADVVWTATGASTNSVYGYYVLDGSGVLRWAERRPGGAVTVGAITGQTYTVSPLFSQRSEF